MQSRNCRLLISNYRIMKISYLPQINFGNYFVKKVKINKFVESKEIKSYLKLLKMDMRALSVKDLNKCTT